LPAMARRLDPDGFVAAPHFAQGVLVPPGMATLYVAGQVAGDDPDGLGGIDVTAQTHATVDRVEAILAAAGMEPADLVQISAHLTDRAHVGAYRAVLRARWGDVRPAAKLVISPLVDPRYLVEIAAVAARAMPA
ncbi:MAG TPA: Rid family hydrolase, partial [Sphingomonas sp.]